MNGRQLNPKLVIALLLFTSSLLHISSARADQFRGIWVDAWGAGFRNKDEVTQLVKHCRTYNFNAVIVQMRRRGDAYYMPQAPNGEPRADGLPHDYDALQELINQCHNGDARIEVHCWVPTHVIWSDKKAPADATHVFNRHPEFVMQDSAGNKYIGEGYYLDPGHPGATRWNYMMAQDIVSRYDIDGFHWDYIRYPAPDSGYNPTAIARYNEEFGLTGKPAPADENFANWRRRQVTDFLRWCNADLLAIKPKLIISCSVFGSRTDAFNARFQDWAAWNKEGIIDLCMPMGYTPEMDLFEARVNDAAAHQGIRRVYQGQGAYLCSRERTVEQLLYIGRKGLKGHVFYSYRVPHKGIGSKSETFELVREKVQPSWKPTPVIPWKVSPTNGILKGVVTREDTGAPVYNAVVTLERISRTQRTEAHGSYGFFETPPGEYLIKATAAGLGSGTATATVTAGTVVGANVVLSTNDTTAPGISNVTVVTVSDTSATITWQTDEYSDSRIEYGMVDVAEYSAFKLGRLLRHSIRLRDLQPGSQYRFRIKSLDAARNGATSTEFKFATLPTGGVADIIIDNDAARVAGTWSRAASAPQKHGKDYFYKGKGSGAAHVEFRPDIAHPGEYDVYEWHSDGANRSTSTPCIIVYAGGNLSTNINQKVDGGKWNLIGRFRFQAGTNGFVRITDAFTDKQRTIAVADAVKFVFAR